mmetsp:Transcript_35290/g.109736  ORF Transcript_35290/g.109736 Transcript_35290/m.109736 type:complete len:233 (+) Transcript_35290:140-838(+)
MPPGQIGSALASLLKPQATAWPCACSADAHFATSSAAGGCGHVQPAVLTADPAAVPGALQGAPPAGPVPEVVIRLRLHIFSLVELLASGRCWLSLGRGRRSSRPRLWQHRWDDGARPGTVPPRAPRLLWLLRALLQPPVAHRFPAISVNEWRESHVVLRANAPWRGDGTGPGAVHIGAGTWPGQSSNEGEQSVDGSLRGACLGGQALNERCIQGREHGHQIAASCSTGCSSR